MISYLKGQILKKNEKGIILDTGNVGYFVHLPATILVNTQEQQAIELFIHSHIREDAFDLYGCSTYAQLSFFKTLLSVSGIGPKIAMEILNNDIGKIKAAILNEDHNYLCKIQGIGQKTAKRMILELKNKIELDDLSEGMTSDYKNSNADIHPDAIDALIRLGYQRHHITKTLRELPEEIKEAEEIITYFLKNN